MVIALAASAFGFGLYLIGGNIFGSRATYRVYSVFDDATGLGQRTRVQIAGIPIGQVDHIEPDQRTPKAPVRLLVRQQFLLHRDPTIPKRSEPTLAALLRD